MLTYPIPMVPGPVKVPPEVLQAYQVNYGSADLEAEFLTLYLQAEANLQTIMATANRVVIQSGEGMVALWAALKSCLVPGDRVLAIATGLFGHGIADMAVSVGAEVEKISLPDDQTLSDLTAVERAMAAFKPKMITAVHCETPSGTLNPLVGLGELKQQYKVPLLYVDAVSSIGGAPVLTDEWQIDLCLGGAQKCLSGLPDTAFMAVSDKAWEVIEQVNYVGYDALKPFHHALEQRYFPYTPNWQGVAGLNAGAELLLQEGLANCFERHEQVAGFCRQGLREMGLDLFPAAGAVASPTVTAVRVPAGIAWEELDQLLRQQGLALGGSYGEMAGKVLRLGHMGTQADMALMEQALAVIRQILQQRGL